MQVTPLSPREAFLREALVAARDVIAAFQLQASRVPGGHSPTMTEAERQAAQALTDIDAVLAQTDPENQA